MLRIRKWLVRRMVHVIEWYQRRISSHTRAVCRYRPTCSQYAIDAITRYGPLKGGLMAAWRILRCNPFSKGGYDPVR